MTRKNNGTKLKPLILLIPCVLALAALFWLEGADVLSSPGGGTEAGQAGSAKSGSDPSGAAGGGAGTLTLPLVVGQAGSLENDIGNPVYAAPDENAQTIGTLQYNCCMLQADWPEEKLPEGWIAVKLSDPDEDAGTDDADGMDETTGSNADDTDGSTAADAEGDESVGFIKRQNVLLKTLNVSDPDPVRMKIARDAVSFLGLRFVRYGDSLTEGIDCSHFVQQIYGRAGVQIPESCNEMRDAGQSVPMHQVRTGDIIYYDVNEGYGHVGIYLGDGCLINATGHAGRTYPDGGVRICALKYRDREEPAAYDLLDQR